MRLPHFDYAAPTTVAEALRLLAERDPTPGSWPAGPT